MPSSREGLKVEIKKLLSEVVDGIDVLSSLEANRGNVVNTIKDVATLNRDVIGSICKEAIVAMRRGIKCERALLMSLRKNKGSLKSREVINLFELMSESSRSTRHLLKEYPNVITDELIRLVRFKVKKAFDKLTMLLALSFLFPIILALTTLFHKFGVLDVILTVLAFQLLLKVVTRLTFHQNLKKSSILDVAVVSFFPLSLALTYVLLNNTLRVALYSLGTLTIYHYMISRNKEREEYPDPSEELLYFELIKGLSVGKSVEQTIIESVRKMSLTKRDKLMSVAASLREGKGIQRSNLMGLGFSVSTALKASLRGRSAGREALSKLLRATRIKRGLFKEMELELRTINFRARVTSFIILTSLVLLTFTSIYLLPTGYNKLKVLCLTYMNSALLFGSSVEFFSLLFVRERALKWGFLQLVLFFVMLSTLNTALTGTVM